MQDRVVKNERVEGGGWGLAGENAKKKRNLCRRSANSWTMKKVKSQKVSATLFHFAIVAPGDVARGGKCIHRDLRH